MSVHASCSVAPSMHCLSTMAPRRFIYAVLHVGCMYQPHRTLQARQARHARQPRRTHIRSAGGNAVPSLNTRGLLGCEIPDRRCDSLALRCFRPKYTKGGIGCGEGRCTYVPTYVRMVCEGQRLRDGFGGIGGRVI